MAFRNNWIKSIMINLVMLIVVMLCCNLTYETNDDFAIAGRIAAGDPYVGYIDYAFCRLLILLQAKLTFINVFVAVQIVISFISFVFILKIFLDSDKGRAFRIVTVMVLLLFSFDQYALIQFTKTSALALTAGMLILIDAMTQRKNPVNYFWAILLLYLGAALRIKNMPIAIGFAGLFLIMWVIENHRRLIPEGYLRPGKLISYVVLLILLGGIGGTYVLSMQMNTATEELRNYQEYNTERSNVVDYSEYGSYDEHTADFTALGFEKNDLYLINKWYFDYDGAASLENLEKIDGIYSQVRNEKGVSWEKAARQFLKNTIGDLKKQTQTGIHLMLLLGIALLALIRMKPKYWIYIVAVGLATAGIYIILYYLGRPAYRAMYIADLNAAVWIMYAMDRSRCWGSAAAKYDGAAGGAADRGSAWRKAGNVIVCCILCLALAGGAYLEYGHTADRHRSIEKGLRPEKIAERIASDQAHMYVFSTREKCNTDPYASPLRLPDAEANVVTFGGWGTLSPYLMKRLQGYDLSNVFGDIIDNDAVYVIEDRNVDRMEQYFNKWYAPDRSGYRIAFVPVDTVDGYAIWQAKTVKNNKN